MPALAPTPRQEFFDGYWPALESQGWESAILHDWKRLPQEIGSDIDYIVAGCRPAKLLRFLSEYCRERGWRLVQAIEHEPDAWFCTCLQFGGDFEILALDVTWNYRRLGHPLVAGSLLLEGRRRVPGKSFHVPAPGAEAAYILAKAAAKNKGFEPVRERIGELVAEDKDGCFHTLERALGFAPGDSPDGRHLEPEIRGWFENAEAFRCIRSGRKLGWAEATLYLRRILQPTGLWLAFEDPVPNQAAVGHITAPLVPLFRQTVDSEKLPFPRILRVLARVIRTSLVIDRSGGRQGGAGDWRLCLDAANRTGNESPLLRTIEHLAERVDKRIKKLSP